MRGLLLVVLVMINFVGIDSLAVNKEVHGLGQDSYELKQESHGMASLDEWTKD